MVHGVQEFPRPLATSCISDPLVVLVAGAADGTRSAILYGHCAKVLPQRREYFSFSKVSRTVTAVAARFASYEQRDHCHA
jgi:hypothetical protein